MVAIPPRQVCPLCVSDEDYEVTVSGDESHWLYTCEAGHDPLTWDVDVPGTSASSREGFLAEHGVYDALLECVHPGEGWAEHGVIEHRYLTANPAVYFRDLLPAYGHVAAGTSARGQSVSLRLAHALAQLRREGLVVYRQWKPTGWWARSSSISSWALPPDPPDEYRVTWTAYAAANGLDPDVWDLTKWATRPG